MSNKSIGAHPAVRLQDRTGIMPIYISPRLRAMDFDQLVIEARKYPETEAMITEYTAGMNAAQCGACARNKYTSRLRVFLAKKENIENEEITE